MLALPVSVLRLDVVGKRLGLLKAVVVVAVVAMVVVRRADIVHLVDAPALGAALQGALLGQLAARISFSAQHGVTNGWGEIVRRAR